MINYEDRLTLEENGEEWSSFGGGYLSGFGAAVPGDVPPSEPPQEDLPPAPPSNGGGGPSGPPGTAGVAPRDEPTLKQTSGTPGRGTGPLQQTSGTPGRGTGALKQTSGTPGGLFHPPAPELRPSSPQPRAVPVGPGLETGGQEPPPERGKIEPEPPKPGLFEEPDYTTPAGWGPAAGGPYMEAGVADLPAVPKDTAARSVEVKKKGPDVLIAGGLGLIALLSVVIALTGRR